MLSVKDLQNLISPKIDENTLQQILQKQSGTKNVVLKKILDKDASSKKGDSYLSEINRFCMVYTKTEDQTNKEYFLHVIAKSLPKNIGRRNTMRSTDFFKNEAAFFNTVWPALDSYQKSRSATGGFQNIPNCLIAYVDGHNDYVLLEDLSILGYKNAERSTILDFEHTAVILRRFAEFHALSIAYRSENPKEFKTISNSLNETYFTEELRPWYEGFQKQVMEIVRDAVSKELSSFYLDKVNALFDLDYLGLMIKIIARDGPLSVISHGDGWMPNFLLSWNDKNIPQDVYIIDFQLARCGSVALDLMFFFYSCTDQPLREKHYNDLLKEYLKSYNAFLKSLGCSNDLQLSLDGLKAEMTRYGSFGLAMPMESIIMSTLEDNEVSDFDVIEGDKAVPLTSVWIIKPLKTKEKRQRLANCIKHCIDQGYLDSPPEV